MTIKFYLDKPSSTLETSIYVFVRFGKTTLKFNTGRKTLPKNWNPNNPETHFRKFTGSVEMNTSINHLRTSLNRLYYSKDEWTVEELRSAINNMLNNKIPKDTGKEFTAALNDFIKGKEHNDELSLSTIKKYKTLENHLANYSKSNRAVLSFEKVNKKLFEDLSGFFRKELGHTTNTVNKYLKTLKTFINWAVDNGYTTSNIVSTKFKMRDDPTEVIYLTWDELMTLYTLDLTENLTLAKVRDVFCFGCFTGQRFSDIANLKRSDLTTNSWILHQIKVKDTVQMEIPLNSYALNILSKYLENERPLPVISNQKTNAYLKILGEKAGIDDIIKIVRYRGNERIELIEPKYMHLGTHTARRTFITLSLEKGMRPETVMGISGHSDYKSMKRYIAVTEKMKTTEMNIIWNSSTGTSKDVRTKKAI
jgi:integrase